jgi:transaldolase
MNKQNPQRSLQTLGQSIWIDNITRKMLNIGALERYRDESSVTGLTSNPTIFDHAISQDSAYDTAIHEGLAKGQDPESIFFGMALNDLARAADIFAPIHQRTNGLDGWVSLEVSPVLAYDTKRSIAAAMSLSQRAARSNLFIKIPGTTEGIPAIEELIFAGIPINVTLLFSGEQYLAAATAYQRGIERRIAAGLNPQVGSVASIFISRWDVAVATSAPAGLKNQLGIAMAGRIYKSYLDVISSSSWLRMYNAGARPQRLLWASTGTKDAHASDILYVEALAAPFTVNTMPEETLQALSRHAPLYQSMAPNGGDSEKILAEFAKAGVDAVNLGQQLQVEGAKSFVKSWERLLGGIAAKGSPILSKA